MDIEEQKKIILKLSEKKDSAFNLRYSANNRKWFIWKIIQYLVSVGIPDAQIEQKTLEKINESTIAVNSRLKKSFSSGSLASKWSVYREMVSRIQIIYGVIGMHPKFLETQYSGYLDFIVERRYRAIKRMVYYVNPNDTRNIFAYPTDSCKLPDPDDPSKSYIKTFVNDTSSSHWVGSFTGKKQLPAILSNTGRTNPTEAIKKIFTKEPTDCAKNLLPCDPVTSILHIDSLLEADDEGKLFSHLINEGDNYLKIDHPFAHFGNWPDGGHLLGKFLQDVVPGNNKEVKISRPWTMLIHKTPENLNKDEYIEIDYKCLINKGNTHEVVEIDAVNPFQQKIRIKQLTHSFQAGTKIYQNLPFSIIPAYHILSDTRPDKAFFEQRSVQVINLQVGDHIYVSNHPLYNVFYPKGVWGGEHAFVIEIDSRKYTSPYFDKRLKVAGHGLYDTLLGMGEDMLKLINNVIVAIQVIMSTHLIHWEQNGLNASQHVQVKNKDIDQVTYKLLEYDLAMNFSNGFVVMQESADSEKFYIYDFFSNDSSRLDNYSIGPIVFSGTSFNTATKYRPENYTVRFFDTIEGKWQNFQLFRKNANGIPIPNQVSFKDFKNVSPFFKLDDDSEIFVTRPRVDFSTNYINFLKDKGAI